MTLQGVKKPTFHAYRILNHLGERELERGEGYIFTKKGERLVAAFYHYPEDYMGTVPMSVYPDQTAALECQSYGEKKNYDFSIAGLRPGDSYTLRILHKEDIAITLWNQMGAPTEPDREQERQLRKQGEVMEEKNVKVNDNGELKLSFVLDSWSVGELN